VELNRARSLASLGKISAIALLLGLMAATSGCNGGSTSTASVPTEPATATAVEPAAAPSASPVATPTGTPTPKAGTGQANADVVHVKAVQAQDGTWTFHVTVEHPDTGWDDYADGWDVVTPDGEVLKPDEGSQYTRTLLHPHQNEQPFTRSQSGIAIPEGVTEVRVRAHDLVDGYGGREVVVDLTADSGPSFEVERR
jgi:hypothetical protein